MAPESRARVVRLPVGARVPTIALQVQQYTRRASSLTTSRQAHKPPVISHNLEKSPGMATARM
eukprot:7217429-Prymnesium_polylepis.1